MKPSKPLRTSAEIEAEIAALPGLQRRAYIINAALDKLVAEHEVALQIQLAGIPVVFIPNRKDAELKVHDLDCAVDNAKGGVFGVSSHSTAGKLAELRTLKSVLATPELAAAVEKLDPLFVELAAARAAEAEAEAAASHARQVVRDEAEQKRAAALEALAAEEERELAAVS